jgi:hypothetical protein
VHVISVIFSLFFLIGPVCMLNTCHITLIFTLWFWYFDFLHLCVSQQSYSSLLAYFLDIKAWYIYKTHVSPSGICLISLWCCPMDLLWLCHMCLYLERWCLTMSHCSVCSNAPVHLHSSSTASVIHTATCLLPTGHIC